MNTERRFNTGEDTGGKGCARVALQVSSSAPGDVRRSLPFCLSQSAGHSGVGCMRSGRFQGPISRILHYAEWEQPDKTHRMIVIF